MPNVTSFKVNGETKQEWTYDFSQILNSVCRLYESGRKTSYDYDITGRVSGVRVKDTSITVNIIKETVIKGYRVVNLIIRQVKKSLKHCQ